jgi:hypothetical protein
VPRGAAFPLRLHELLDGRRFALLLYADHADQISDLATASTVAREGAHSQLEVVFVLATSATVPDEVADRPLRDAPAAVVWDLAGEFQAAYGAIGGCCHVVRPDQHVSFRAGQPRADELASHLALMVK